ALSHKIIENLGMDWKKVIVIQNGVDRDKFSVKENKNDTKKLLGLNQNKQYLIFVGQLQEVKGINNLIEALSILQKRKTLFFDTVLIGEGPLRYEITQLIKEKELTEKVYLRGNRPHDEIPLWMNAGDILCLPSLREGLPSVILEALACGLPVVATQVGGIPELISEDNGILVEPQNAAALANSIEIAFRKEWDREVISKGVEQFSWGRSAELYLKVYEEVLSGE
ncbi:MAG: glycosyltransferase, partial [Nitrospirota bacterium]